MSERDTTPTFPTFEEESAYHRGWLAGFKERGVMHDEHWKGWTRTPRPLQVIYTASFVGFFWQMGGYAESRGWESLGWLALGALAWGWFVEYGFRLFVRETKARLAGRRERKHRQAIVERVTSEPWVGTGG